MLEESALGDGWTVWNDEGDRFILAYRPDVFDGDAFPAECLPTVYVTRGRRRRRPAGNRNLPPNAPWTVTLFLEPDVDAGADAHDTLEGAIEAAEHLTRQFSAGEFDYRDCYQVPRETYFERLDELTGREE